MNPVYNKWYMDDGGIIADVGTLQKVWDLLLTKGPSLGLRLNAAKCEWSWLDASRTEEVPIPEVKFVPTDEICMLGVPLMPSAWAEKYVQSNLVA